MHKLSSTIVKTKYTYPTTYPLGKYVLDETLVFDIISIELNNGEFLFKAQALGPIHTAEGQHKMQIIDNDHNIVFESSVMHPQSNYADSDSIYKLEQRIKME